MKKDYDITKLPQWAQRKIRVLEKNIKTLERKVAEINGERKTNTAIISGMDRNPLPNSCTIEFDITGNRISCGIIDNELRVYGYNTIIVLPRASNSIHLK